MEQTASYVTTWVNLEDFILKEISQSQNKKYCMIPIGKESQIGKFEESKKGMVVARGWEEVKMGSY